MQGYNSQTVLLKITNDKKYAIESMIITVYALSDFIKAFDTVDHGILLSIVREIGCSNKVLAWFSAYLLDRQ